jgi:hypothetical protein
MASKEEGGHLAISFSNFLWHSFVLSVSAKAAQTPSMQLKRRISLVVCEVHVFQLSFLVDTGGRWKPESELGIASRLDDFLALLVDCIGGIAR